jgi:hypothetical protein
VTSNATLDGCDSGFLRRIGRPSESHHLGWKLPSHRLFTVIRIHDKMLLQHSTTKGRFTEILPSEVLYVDRSKEVMSRSM